MANKSEATLILKIKETGSQAIDAVRGKLSGLTPSMETLKKVAKGVATVFGAVATAAVTLAEKAGRFQGVQRSFSSLAESQSQDAQKMLANMKELSGGMISDMKLMEQANNAMLLGLPVDRFGDMLKVAQSASVATGQSMDFMLHSIVTGLGRGSKLMLDNLGILIDVGKANDDYARALGRTSNELTEAERKQAFINAALDVGLENTKNSGEGALTLNQNMQVLKASMDNFSIVMGQAATPAVGFFTDKLKTLFTESNNGVASSSLQEFFTGVAKGASLVWNLFEQVGRQVGTVIAGISGALMAFVNGDFRGAFTNVKMIATESWENVKTTWEKANKDIEDIDRRHRQHRIDGLKKEGEDKARLREEQALADADRELKKFESEQQIQMARRQLEIDAIGADEAKKLDIKQKSLDLDLKQATTAAQKKQIWQKKQDLHEQQAEQAMTDFKKAEAERREKNLRGSLGIISTLSRSNNKVLATIGKAAAIAQIAMDTPVAIGRALASAPPPFNFALAGAVGVAMAAQAAQVAGVQLAEGGIVSARPGGIQATIGEGGRSEAVIPLPDDFDPDQGLGMGASINFTFSGPILGDEAQAREFALAIDEKLLELRRSNESQAFDQDVI